MINLFGVDLNTPNFVASYLSFIQQFDASYSFGEQGQSSSVVATQIENIETKQHHCH